MNTEIDLILFVLSQVVLAILSGACVALEVLSLSRSDKPADDEDGSGRVMGWLSDDPVNVAVALGVGRAAAVIFTVVMAVRVGWLHLFAASNQGPLFTAVLVVAAILLPVFVAKVAALYGAERFLNATRAVTYPVAYMIRPIALLVGAGIKRISPSLLRMLAFQIVPLKQKIEMFGYQNGDADDEEQQLMSSLMDFGETRVREVMVPRVDIVAVNVALDKNEAVETVIEAGHSRIPVFEETIDRIIGTIYTKDLLSKIALGEEFSLRELARDAFFVPESKMIDELLTEFKNRKQHVAIVVDEYGGTAGIVTLEDVLEELVGDIQDEFDTEEALIERVDDDSVICNAKVHLDDLHERFGLELPPGDSDSLGGFLYQTVGSVPPVGERVKHDPLEFEILSVVRQRIDKVLIKGLKSVEKKFEDAP